MSFFIDRDTMHAIFAAVDFGLIPWGSPYRPGREEASLSILVEILMVHPQVVAELLRRYPGNAEDVADIKSWANCVSPCDFNDWRDAQNFAESLAVVHLWLLNRKSDE